LRVAGERMSGGSFRMALPPSPWKRASVAASAKDEITG
jgi:hypothetical protein